MKAVLHQATQYLQIIFESNQRLKTVDFFASVTKNNDLHHVPWRLSGARCPALQRWRKKFKKMLTWSRQRRSKTGVPESSALRGVWIESILIYVKTDTDIEYVLALLLPARPPPGHSHMMFPKPFHAARLKSGIIRGFLFWNQLRRQLQQPFWHEHAITKGSNCIDETLGKSKGFSQHMNMSTNLVAEQRREGRCSSTNREGNKCVHQKTSFQTNLPPAKDHKFAWQFPSQCCIQKTTVDHLETNKLNSPVHTEDFFRECGEPGPQYRQQCHLLLETGMRYEHEIAHFKWFIQFLKPCAVQDHIRVLHHDLHTCIPPVYLNIDYAHHEYHLSG